MKRPEKKLVLENGQEFYGVGCGADCRRVCEVVFNTSVVGYQEILSDPSYADQIVIMTYPLIGNYGITDEDFESRSSCLGIPCSSSSSSRVLVKRKLLGVSQHSRTTSPPRQELLDSKSSSVIP